MTLDVYRGRKTTTQQQQQLQYYNNTMHEGIHLMFTGKKSPIPILAAQGTMVASFLIYWIGKSIGYVPPVGVGPATPCIMKG